MVSDGIYEQILNRKLSNELRTLDLSEYDIDLKSLDPDDARKILTIYISSVIQRGLRYIRESHRSNENKEALCSQIKLCNDIIDEIAIHCKDDDFKLFNIEEKGELLRSLYSKLNTARAITEQKTVRPETSIAESTLFTGAKTEPSMLNEIKKEIVSCDGIDLLVSFIKWSAIVRILPELKEFTSRTDSKLRILTTTYMQATDFKAIDELSKLPNTEIKINYETDHMRMHAKSYYFKRNTGFSTAYIGSSNLSNPALTDGLEWNMKITEQESFDIIKKIAVTFESYWNNSLFEPFHRDIPECSQKLRSELSKNRKPESSSFHLHCTIRPYPYQQEILDALNAEREIYGHHKNLVVGSTGVGKTLIAAFDFKEFQKRNPRAKLLFVAHRKEILHQSRQKFREVLNDFNFGDCFVGGEHPTQIDHLFISIQSLNSSEFTTKTSADFYDYIVVDEFHHAAAASYQSLLDYYHPKILLGLTATPERMDGKSILHWFDDRIAAEMRLPEALDRKLLCPFQYFGITDPIDYRRIKWRGKYDVSELEAAYIAPDEIRASIILKSIDQYISDIDDVKGLGFCVSIKHAEYMASYFNKHGIPSIALSAQSADDIRDSAQKSLSSGEIRFIFVVDLYNEGVDIKEVNTILFLRPTESATVFLQQLGRGLRLHESKQYLTVLDFVGHCHNKYRIENKFRALVGKTKHSIKSQVESGFSELPRGCYIHLEKEAREYVLRNLKDYIWDKTSLTQKVKTFESDSGQSLTLENFVNYYNIPLTELYRPDGTRTFTQLKQWAGLVQEIPEIGKDIWHAIIGLIHINSPQLLEYWIHYIQNEELPKCESERLMRNMLYYSFYRQAPDKHHFSDIAEGIHSILKYPCVRTEILELLHYKRAHLSFVPSPHQYHYECPLELHCTYNTCQILAAFGYYNEESSPEFREGVKYLADKKTDAFFINLNKSEKDFSPSTMYDDYAINDTLFHWQSQSQTSDTSKTAQRYFHHKENNSYISLFVREFKKVNGYTCAYTFLGNAHYVEHSGSKPVSITWELEAPIPSDMLPAANKSVAV